MEPPILYRLHLSARPLLPTLLRLQALAFKRAPYFGGRVALAVLKGLGLVYAVTSAALLGFLLPDTLSVWAPDVSALDLVGVSLLPAIGMLTSGRVLFQDVPTRGAEAFLLLPVSRERIARAVTQRAALTVFNLAPIAFAVPFAARSVRAALGVAEAVWFVLGVAGLVAISHFAVVVWKTRLGTAPRETLGVVGTTAAVTTGLAYLSGGALGPSSAAVAIGAAAIAVGLGVHAHRCVVASFYLDPPAQTSRGSVVETSSGFERPGVWAFLDLEWRLVSRSRFPRGIALNALAMTVFVGTYTFAWNTAAPAVLLLLFSTGTLAISAGQFALPFASGHYDRLLTLPGAPRAFVRAKLAMAVGSTVVLGGVQLLLALLLAPSAWLDLSGAVLFCAGVLAPVAVFGSTLAPKPLDVEDKFMGSPRIQSLPPQIVLALAAAVAVALVAGLGPDAGLVATAAVGLVGALGLPLWARMLEGRIVAQRYAVAERFRSVL